MLSASPKNWAFAGSCLSCSIYRPSPVVSGFFNNHTFVLDLIKLGLSIRPFFAMVEEPAHYLVAIEASFRRGNVTKKCYWLIPLLLSSYAQSPRILVSAVRLILRYGKLQTVSYDPNGQLVRWDRVVRSFLASKFRLCFFGVQVTFLVKVVVCELVLLTGCMTIRVDLHETTIFSSVYLFFLHGSKQRSWANSNLIGRRGHLFPSWT